MRLGKDLLVWKLCIECVLESAESAESAEI